MENNPWFNIRPNDYDAHMSHPNVKQTQILNRIIKEQLELIPASVRPASKAAILGITNGNGLEHVVSCNVGHIIGIDINPAFLDECRTRFPDLTGRLSLYQMDLTTEMTESVTVLSECDLIIANLIIEHIHLNNFVKIMKGLSKHGQIVSCVIQVNPDSIVASKSGIEQLFDDIVKYTEEENITTLDRVMQNSGYFVNGKTVYDLPNSKQLIQSNYTTV